MEILNVLALETSKIHDTNYHYYYYYRRNIFENAAKEEREVEIAEPSKLARILIADI